MKKNPVAKDLRTPKYRQRKVESKKKYNRKEVVGYYYDVHIVDIADVVLLVENQIF